MRVSIVLFVSAISRILSFKSKNVFLVIHGQEGITYHESGVARWAKILQANPINSII